MNGKSEEQECVHLWTVWYEDPDHSTAWQRECEHCAATEWSETKP